MAQQTRRGHTYVISNVGSFLFKVGKTRQLEPLDRVKELSDASLTSIKRTIEEHGVKEIHWTMKVDTAEYRGGKSL